MKKSIYIWLLNIFYKPMTCGLCISGIYSISFLVIKRNSFTNSEIFPTIYAINLYYPTLQFSHDICNIQASIIFYFKLNISVTFLCKTLLDIFQTWVSLKKIILLLDMIFYLYNIWILVNHFSIHVYFFIDIEQRATVYPRYSLP